MFEEVPIHQFLRTEGAAYCSYLFSMVSSEDTTANIAQYFLPGKTGHRRRVGTADNVVDQFPDGNQRLYDSVRTPTYGLLG